MVSHRNPPAAKQQRGFTLIELLVAIGIVGLLMAILLPAVQNARESARAAICRSHLRQIGIALQNYHSAHDCFPPGCMRGADNPIDIQGWGWATFLLPYLEETALYNSLQPTRNTFPQVLASAELQPFLRVPVAVLRCPSDIGDELQNENRTLSGFVLGSTQDQYAAKSQGPRVPLMLACLALPPPGFGQMGDPVANPPDNPTSGDAPIPGDFGVRAATSNYVASFGDFWRPEAASWTDADYAGNGVFGSNTVVRIRDIGDGTSQTFAVGERSWQNYASIWAGADGWNRCEREGVAMVLGTAHFPINSAPEPYYLSCNPQGAAGFDSLHPGGCNFVMVDGSVRFIGEDIDFALSHEAGRRGVFQKLARRNNAQID